MILHDEYEKLVGSGRIKDDAAQRKIISQLELLSNLLEENFSQKPSGMLRKIIPFPSKNHGIRGLYIYGEVGRGKSMLMDLFFTKLQITKKKRVHFHAFMLGIHASLYKWRSENRDNLDATDPIPIIAKDIAKETTVLCFDELQVTDIADAMILGRLFTALFKNGVVVVATSNRPPEDLYKDGLQSERFQPFIALIKEKLSVSKLAANEDYRLAHLKSFKVLYHSPLDKNAHKFLEKAFADLTSGAKPESVTLEVSGRKIIIPKTHNGVAWVTFADLCEKPLGAADYIQIAREFSTLLLEDIPKLTRENRNEAKRFVTLIDELYEHKVKLIATAEAKPESLYIAGDGSFEFQRTVSRLIEMQSEQYLGLGHFV